MEILIQLQERYAQYAAQVKSIQKKYSPLAGIFGTGGGPKTDPCHDAFYQDVEALVDRYLTDGPTQDVTEDVVSFLLRTPQEHKGTDAYWYMLAAQGHTKKLIPQLSPESRRTLHDWFQSAYPKRLRTPMQDELLNLLGK